MLNFNSRRKLYRRVGKPFSSKSRKELKSLQEEYKSTTGRHPTGSWSQDKEILSKKIKEHKYNLNTSRLIQDSINRQIPKLMANGGKFHYKARGCCNKVKFTLEPTRINLDNGNSILIANLDSIEISKNIDYDIFNYLIGSILKMLVKMNKTIPNIIPIVIINDNGNRDFELKLRSMSDQWLPLKGGMFAHGLRGSRIPILPHYMRY